MSAYKVKEGVGVTMMVKQSGLRLNHGMSLSIHPSAVWLTPLQFGAGGRGIRATCADLRVYC